MGQLSRRDKRKVPTCNKQLKFKLIINNLRQRSIKKKLNIYNDSISKPNISLESILKGITCSKAKQDSQLAKIVDQNQEGFVKIKGSVRIKENLADIPDPISTEQELDNTLQLDGSSYKTLINNQSISSENSGKTSESNSIFYLDTSIVIGSSNCYVRLLLL